MLDMVFLGPRFVFQIFLKELLVVLAFNDNHFVELELGKGVPVYHPIWRITPLSKWLVNGVTRHLELGQPYLGDLLTMVINHLLDGMILQVSKYFLICFDEHGNIMWATKKPSYFPLNPGWLIGILILVYEIITI